MSKQFKVGDRVRYVYTADGLSLPEYEGKVGTVVEEQEAYDWPVRVKWDDTFFPNRTPTLHSPKYIAPTYAPRYEKGERVVFDGKPSENAAPQSPTPLAGTVLADSGYDVHVQFDKEIDGCHDWFIEYHQLSAEVPVLVEKTFNVGDRVIYDGIEGTNFARASSVPVAGTIESVDEWTDDPRFKYLV